MAYNHNITGGSTHLTLPCTSGELMSHLGWTHNPENRTPIVLHVIYDGSSVFMVNTLARNVVHDEAYMEMRKCKVEGKNMPFAATFAGMHNAFNLRGRHAFRNDQSPVQLFCSGTNDPILTISGIEIVGEQGYKAYASPGDSGDVVIPHMDVLYELRVPYNALRRAVRDSDINFFVSFRHWATLAFHEVSAKGGPLVEVQPSLKGMTLYTDKFQIKQYYQRGNDSQHHVQLHQDFVTKRLRRAGVRKNDLISIGVAGSKWGKNTTIHHYVGLNLPYWKTRTFFERAPFPPPVLVKASVKNQGGLDPRFRKSRAVFIPPPAPQSFSMKVTESHEIWSPRTEPGFIWEEPEMNEKDKAMVREWFTAYLNAEAKKGEEISSEHKEAFQRLTS